MLKTKYNNFKEELHMYLVKTTNGDKILNSADAVKSIKKEIGRAHV